MAAPRAPQPAERRGSLAPDISPGRAALVNLIIACIVAGYAVSIVWEVELFPFSYFPMYSGSRAGVSQYHALAYVGIVGSRELQLSRQQLEELSVTRKKYLDRYLGRMRRRPERALALLAKLTALSHVRGATLSHPIPALDGMRIYRDTYSLDPWARNRGKPDQRKLLLEFPVPGAETGTE